MVDAAHLRANRTRLRFARRMVHALREDAVSALAEAKAAHDRLEAVYRPYVDFAGLDELARQELARLEARLA